MLTFEFEYELAKWTGWLHMFSCVNEKDVAQP